MLDAILCCLLNVIFDGPLSLPQPSIIRGSVTWQVELGVGMG